jgi:outer membrane biosynthesis protein TonB
MHLDLKWSQLLFSHLASEQSTMMIINKAVLAMFALLLGSTLAVGEFGDVEFIEDLPEDQVFWGARLLEGSMSVAPTPKPPNPPSGPTPTEKPVETPTEKPVEPPTPSPPSGTVPTEAPPTVSNAYDVSLCLLLIV